MMLNREKFASTLRRFKRVAKIGSGVHHQILDHDEALRKQRDKYKAALEKTTNSGWLHDSEMYATAKEALDEAE